MLSQNRMTVWNQKTQAKSETAQTGCLLHPSGSFAMMSIPEMAYTHHAPKFLLKTKEKPTNHSGQATDGYQSGFVGSLGFENILAAVMGEVLKEGRAGLVSRGNHSDRAKRRLQTKAKSAALTLARTKSSPGKCNQVFRILSPTSFTASLKIRWSRRTGLFVLCSILSQTHFRRFNARSQPRYV